MPLAFPCACGVMLSVREDPPVYYARCPKCQTTNQVPHPKKNAKKSTAKDDPGFEVVKDPPYSPAFDGPRKNEDDEEWEKTPYEKPTVKGGYQVGAAPSGPRGATKGSGENEPYEVSQEEFEEEEEERSERRRKGKPWRAIAFGITAIIAIGALVFAGKASRMLDPGGNGRVGVGVARIAILFTFGVVSFVIWMVRHIGDDE